MNMSDLSDVERTVLIDLVAQVVLADDETSFEELKELEEIADEMGHDSFDAALAAARGKTRDEVLQSAKLVQSKAARDLIRTVLHDVAHVDGVADEEAAVLSAVADIWRE